MIEGTTVNRFDPSKYITKVSGRDYIEVKLRLVWLRTDYPDASIETEHIELTNTRAVFKASVTLSSGASASGYGSETPGDFGDYIEKAETKAIGRALGALGFGTQFTYDFDEGSHHDGTPNIVDSPAGRQQPQRIHAETGSAPYQQGGTNVAPVTADVPSEAQWKYMHSLADERGFDADSFNTWIEDNWGKEKRNLTKYETSKAIETLKAMPKTSQK